MAAPNPLSLIAMGIGTLGSLGSGISDMAGAADRKRRYLEDEKRKAQILALRHQGWGDWGDKLFPKNALDARWKRYEVRQNAEDNPAFNPNPMSLVPFVGNATALAGGIYDAAKGEPSQYDNAIKGALKQPPIEELQDAPATPTPAYLLPAPGTEDPLINEPQRQLASSSFNERDKPWWA